jgi:sugar/nucleoside kinase (ribokinase family)
MRPLAVLGHLALDVVDGADPRIGGAPWYSGRALRTLGLPAQIGAKCGEPDRSMLQARLTELGVPVVLATGGETTRFSFRYEGDRRLMHVDAIGEPWSPEEAVTAADQAEWVHVAPLLRSDFPTETLAALGRDRRLMLDGQGLVRVPHVGPLQLDPEFDPALLRAVSILKFAEEEAIAVVGSAEAVVELGVPEVVVTLGSLGALVLANGELRRIPAQPLDGIKDPTGAGDAFSAAYLAARSEGDAPADAARHATALVASVLVGPTR